MLMNLKYNSGILNTKDLVYVDFGARAIAAVESMKKAGTWPALDYTKCSDFDFDNPSPVARSLDLKSAIQV